MESIKDKRRFFEIMAAIITGFGKIVFINVLDQKLIFIIIACLFWIGYVIFRHYENSNILNYWGFTKNNFGKSFKRLLPFVLVSIVSFALYGILSDSIIINWHIIPIFIIYPIWGVIQQFIVVGLIAGNLNDQNKIKLSKLTIVIITAALFSVVHYPSIMLIIGTFILAVIYSLEYLKDRNLWVLGLYHGWLACFFYFFVLNRDPFIEAFGKVFE